VENCSYLRCGALGSGEENGSVKRCHECNATILFGASERPWGTFCRAACAIRSAAAIAEQEDEGSEVEIDEAARALCAGPCPTCDGPGPVDLRYGSRVTSVVAFSFTEKRTLIGCRSCVQKGLKRDLTYTALAGFWSIFGLIAAPAALIATTRELRRPWESEPSPEVRALVGQQRIHQRSMAFREATPLESRLGGSWL
jgi:hypothetical protein